MSEEKNAKKPAASNRKFEVESKTGREKDKQPKIATEEYFSKNSERTDFTNP